MPANRAEGHIQSLVSALQQCPDTEYRNIACELVTEVLELHFFALNKVLELIANDERGSGLLERLGQEPQIRAVLLLHGLHPSPLENRIHQALEEVRPSLKAHHGDVELLAVEEPAVRLRLVGTCNGCPSSTTTFKNLIETAITEYAPEIETIDVEGIAAP